MSEIVPIPSHIPKPDPERVAWRPSGLDMKEVPSLDPAAMVLFLAHYAIHGNIAMACISAKVPRKTVMKCRLKLPAFKDAMQKAFQESNDLLEFEAYRRAVIGVTDDKRKYSDSLHKMLLEGRHKRYRKKPQVAVEVNNTNEQTNQSLNIEAGPTPPGDLSDWASSLSEVAKTHKAGDEKSNGST